MQQPDVPFIPYELYHSFTNLLIRGYVKKEVVS